MAIVVEVSEAVLIHVHDDEEKLDRHLAEEAARNFVHLYRKSGTERIGREMDPIVQDGKKVWPIQVLVVDRIAVPETPRGMICTRCGAEVATLLQVTPEDALCASCSTAWSQGEDVQ